MDKINFAPYIWGGSAWKFLHIVALSFPNNPTQQQKNDYKQFFLSLDKILPCSKCSEHFQENKTKHNINKYLSDPHSLFSWTVKMRNELQKSINKPLIDELKLRNSLYDENTTKIPYFSYKGKIIIIILSFILTFFLISKFFKIKIIHKK